MNDSRIFSISQLKDFLKLDGAIKFTAISKKEKCLWINDVLEKFSYFRLRKKDRSIVKDYIIKLTMISPAQLGRYIERKKHCGKVWLASTKRHRFPRVYSPEDIALLIKTDNLHLRLSGKATKKILEREYGVFSKNEYQKIARISIAHLYNLRATRQYQSHALTVKATTGNRNNIIGKREKPSPEGQPGFIRVDTVHQGDLEKEKGVYHINLIDEVTQWEIVGCVEKISERFLEPLLSSLITQFPFKIINFHSDNGSEYLNKIIAKLLNKLLIKQTKSRTRHCNDNALVETKNGSIIRKHMGYAHIKQKYANEINKFYQTIFNPYLNYHRPCGYAETKTDHKRKQTKTYPAKSYQTPYDKLRSISEAKKYLKSGIVFDKLNEIAYAKSDNEWAEIMKQNKTQLFENFRK